MSQEAQQDPTAQDERGTTLIPSPHRHTYTPPPMASKFLGKHVISVDQFSRDDLDTLFDATRSIRRRLRNHDRGLTEICAGYVMASLFFEASTRTDMSFQAAMRRLGGDVIAASNGVRFSSMYKGESFADTIRAAGCYADVIVIRHPQIGSSYEAAYYMDRLNQRTNTPGVVVSGGDGVGEHPTQALLDLFTIIDYKQQLDGLTITMVGDLRNGRTVHSLAKLIAYYRPKNMTLGLVSPPALRMPDEVRFMLRDLQIELVETEALLDILPVSDVVYWTRVQEERFSDPSAYEAIKDGFILTPPTLERARKDMILMHPLPRKHEMGTLADHDVLDQDPRSIYFEQMENGMFVRMALLAKVTREAYV